MFHMVVVYWLENMGSKAAFHIHISLPIVVDSTSHKILAVVPRI